MTTGIDLELPRAGASAMTGNDHAIQISVDARGRYFLSEMELPRDEVVKRAREILHSIESGTALSRPTPKTEREPDLFSAITVGRDSEAADRIRATDINTITPIEAMNLLFELKRLLDEGR